MHPIYALWSHPRSMSTAIERIMRERGDLDCAHEPFMYDYYVHRRVREMPHFEVAPGHPRSYGEIRDMLLDRAAVQPVFIKDMSYYVMPHILEDAVFLARLRNMFLIRRPRAAIVSYHKLDPEVTDEEIGITAQAAQFRALEARGARAVVIRAEDVRADPRGMIGALWRAVGLAPADHAFDWQNEVPQDWQQVEGWHGRVLQSAGIAPPDPQAETREAERFDALCARAPHVRSLLDRHEPHYRHLSAHALAPGV
ncbi:hypothetical protein [Ruegeria sp. HKCCD8929]|uniref:sulfotransferase-like domain-containing protein n=1 Tax=Ruegeria sp. HKCCD8929 TaxID=2683006 RepID=UPI001489C197|nr:hypothetical protein [Ruegeria sp. HKCCD8929]